MTLNDMIFIGLALVGGVLVGLFYFWSLKKTVQLIVTAKHPAVILIFSYIVRTALTLLAFYFIMGGVLWRLLACLAGFIIARVFLVKRETTPTPEKKGEVE